MIGPEPQPAYEAVLFDLDGVVLDTAAVHTVAWRRSMEALLASLRDDPPPGADLDPFEDADYRRHIDGRPRLEGIATFLAARGLRLAEGDPLDLPGLDTIHALGNLKNETFRQILDEQDVKVFASTVSLHEVLVARGVWCGVVSASRNAAPVLAAAGLAERFPILVDGEVAAREGLAGKPDPATYVAAADWLGVPVERTAVIEDAIAGVEAGRRGGFGLVVGVDRSGESAADMVARGADVVVADLVELDPAAMVGDGDGLVRLCPLRSRPVADPDDALELLGDRRLAVLLDYDGTLSPIVDDPAEAVLPESTRDVLASLAPRVPVGVVSGRGLEDVRARVGIEGLYYLGSHGFELAGPGEPGRDHPDAAAHLPALDRAERTLTDELDGVPGVLVERKRFGVSTHYRRVDPVHHERVRAAVERVDAAEDGLRLTTGKMVLELRPALHWHKGTAIRWMMDALAATGAESVPLFIGDDVTDEDGFEAIGEGGITIVVGMEPRMTRAGWRLDSPAHVARFLAGVADRLEVDR